MAFLFDIPINKTVYYMHVDDNLVFVAHFRHSIFSSCSSDQGESQGLVDVPCFARKK